MSANSGTRTTGPANAKPWIFENKSHGRFDVRRAPFTADLVEAEMRGIFDRSWLYAGHESEIPNNGDFVTRTVAGRPLVLVRSSDGMIRVQRFNGGFAIRRGLSVLDLESLQSVGKISFIL